MIKRTMGRFLLTVLVITGLAGTINNTSISKQERKTALNLMKDTRAEVLKCVRGLSKTQLNFKSAPDHWSIKDCIYHIAISEKSLWRVLERTMRLPANPEKRADIGMTDEELVQTVEDRDRKLVIATGEPKKMPFSSTEEAIDAYRNLRTDHIRYMKSSTEDLRNHVVQMSFGTIDCYQLCLVIAALNNRYCQQIESIKADPRFPH